jgi:hypothetical protein
MNCIAKEISISYSTVYSYKFKMICTTVELTVARMNLRRPPYHGVTLLMPDTGYL